MRGKHAIGWWNLIEFVLVYINFDWFCIELFIFVNSINIMPNWSCPTYFITDILDYITSRINECEYISFYVSEVVETELAKWFLLIKFWLWRREYVRSWLIFEGEFAAVYNSTSLLLFIYNFICYSTNYMNFSMKIQKLCINFKQNKLIILFTIHYIIILINFLEIIWAKR